MRPPKDEVFLRMAAELSRLSTCHRLHVGCVLVDSRGQIDGTGFNGVASGLPHCNERSPGALIVDETPQAYPYRCKNSDAQLGAPNGCEAVHAEQNALMQCSDRFRLAVAYTTHSPCLVCTKMLLNTCCRRVVFLYEYPAPQARDLWRGAGREWVQLGLTFP